MGLVLWMPVIHAQSVEADLVAKYGMALKDLGTPVADGGDPVRGETLLREAADGGYGPAQIVLVVEYSSGRRLRKDPDLARQYYAKAQASDTRGQAAAALGLRLWADGGEAGRPEAIGLLETATRKGQADPAYALYRESMAGRYQTQDNALAFLMLREAARRKHLGAMIYLGEAYLTGTSIKPDQAQGRALLEEATRAGSVEAATVLSNHYDALLQRFAGLSEAEQRAYSMSEIDGWGERFYRFAALAAVNGDDMLRVQFIEAISGRTALAELKVFTEATSNLPGGGAGYRMTEEGRWAAAMTRYHFRKRLGAATAPDWLRAWHLAAEDYLAGQPDFTRVIDQRVDELDQHWLAAQKMVSQYQP